MVVAFSPNSPHDDTQRNRTLDISITMYPEHGHTETPFPTLQQIQNPFRHDPMYPNKQNTNDHRLYAKSQ